MKIITFSVTFLSDVVLPATSNTGGNIQQLDFIPGSTFLGMVAKEYHCFDNSFEVFHNGAVRFGDATLQIDGKPSFKIPTSFFHEKLDDTKLYNHHQIKDFTLFKQLKQKREGYITEDLDEDFVNYVYAQKSAYNKENRRSKESGMYGYNAIQSGTSWLFDVSVKDGIDASKIINILENSTQLGKSKSAHYGRIQIKYLNEEVKQTLKIEEQKETILYANSRLALFDKEGNPTLDPKYLCPKIGECNIVYEKTQLRTGTFTPFNTKRQTKDYERVCINKGSVIVLKEVTQEQLDTFVDGVGGFLCEGFGAVLVNPSFLEKESFELRKIKPKTIREKSKITTHLAKFLDMKKETQHKNLEIAKVVDTFARDHKVLYSNIKASQWGNIRSICTGSPNDYVDQCITYISSGVKKWDEKQIKTLEKHMISQDFTKLLAIKMGKIAQEGKKDGK